MSLPRIVKRTTLHDIIQHYSKCSILYEWDDASIEKMKNYTSDYETPPSSPEHPIENGSGPITITQPPFRILPTTQVSFNYTGYSVYIGNPSSRKQWPKIG